MAKNSQHQLWQSRIMAINDRKLLEYIQDMARIRLDHARAQENLDKPEKSNKETGSPTSSYEPPPRKLKPLKMVPVAQDTNSEEQYF